jgi:hypothetical protein
MIPGFFTTRLLFSVDVETQFGPAGAAQLVNDLLSCPAVRTITLLKCATNYPGPHKPPSSDFREVPVGDL